MKTGVYIIVLSGFLLLCIVIAYGLWIEPFQIDVRHITIRTSKFKHVLKGKTVVHLSDLHIRAIGRREKKVLALMEELDPDLILMTGDYVRWRGDYNPAISFFSNLRANIGVWAVMGDYDYSDTRNSCLFCHNSEIDGNGPEHGVHFLRNRAKRLILPGGDLFIVGVSTVNIRFAPLNGEFGIPSIKGQPRIILSHSPLLFDVIDERQEVLILAGDTHGGQIALPRWMWRLLDYEKCALYAQGMFQEGKKRMYVSRGIGTSFPHFRLLRPPEVVVFHF